MRRCSLDMAVTRYLREIMIVGLILITALAPTNAAEPREEKQFGSNPGNLRMFSYVPEGANRSAALIVVLHGCKQGAVTFARDAGWLALADSSKVSLLLPEQKGLPSYLYDSYVFWWFTAIFGANNQNACFNWFEPEDTTRDHGEALSIRQMIDTMVQRHSVEPSQVYIVGLSAGAAMAAAMLANYPELFRGGAFVAGVPYGCANTVAQALQCMNPGVDRTADDWGARARVGTNVDIPVAPVSIWHGTADTRVSPRNQRELVEQWTALHGIPPTAGRITRSGTIERTIYTDNAGVGRVEGVTVDGLGHAFPIDGSQGCGQPGDFVALAGVCAASEIARFWGLNTRPSN